MSMVYNKMKMSKIMAEANAACRDYCPKSLEPCSIINAKSGLCGEDCKFCAQSARHSTNVATYPLISKGEILKAAMRAKMIGAKRFGIVTSGNVLSQEEIIKIAGIVR